MEAYYYGKYHPLDEGNIKQIYTIWRKNNLSNRQYIDANKLANVRRQILRNKRLIDTDISQIEKADKNMIPERNVEPVLRMENLDNEEIEQMISKIRKKIKQQEKQTDKTELENQGRSQEFFGRWLKVFKNVGEHGWTTKKILG